MSTVGHLNDDVLERYAMNSLVEAEAEAVEDHLSLCTFCLDRMDETTAFVQGIQGALQHYPAAALAARADGQATVAAPGKWRFPQWLQTGWALPVWAAGAAAAAVMFFANVHQSGLPAPALMVLDATRGASYTTHGAGPFDFALFVPAAGNTYHLELLDDHGAKKWSSVVTGHNGQVHAIVNQRLPEGQYFLDVTEPVSGIQHEYAVRVQK